MKKYLLLLLLLSCTSSSLVVGAEADAQQKDDTDRFWIEERQEKTYHTFLGALQAYMNEYQYKALHEDVLVNSGKCIFGNTITPEGIFPVGRLSRLSNKTELSRLRCFYVGAGLATPITATEFSVDWAYKACSQMENAAGEGEEGNIYCVYLYKGDAKENQLFHSDQSTRPDNDNIIETFFPHESGNDTYMFAGAIVEGKQLQGRHI